MPNNRGIKIGIESFSHLPPKDQNEAVFNYLIYIDNRLNGIEKQIKCRLKINTLLTFIGGFLGGFCAHMGGVQLLTKWFLKI